MRPSIVRPALGIATLAAMLACDGAEGDGRFVATSPGPAPSTAPGSADDAASSDDGTTGADDDPPADCEPAAWYPDADGDGAGDRAALVMSCHAPPAYVPFGDDCDDADADRFPDADEVCNATDDDCDGTVDEPSPTNATCGGCTLAELAGVPGRGYALCPAPATWLSARASCSARGGDLWVIDDVDEFQGVMSFAFPVAAAHSWYLGLNDAIEEGSFVDVAGRMAPVALWQPGQPDSSGGDEDCVELSLPQGLWNDVTCSAARPYVCEIPAD